MRDNLFLFLIIIGLVISIFVVINYQTKAGIIYAVIAGMAFLVATQFDYFKKKLGGART